MAGGGCSDRRGGRSSTVCCCCCCSNNSVHNAPRHRLQPPARHVASITSSPAPLDGRPKQRRCGEGVRARFPPPPPLPPPPPQSAEMGNSRPVSTQRVPPCAASSERKRQFRSQRCSTRLCGHANRFPNSLRYAQRDVHTCGGADDGAFANAPPARPPPAAAEVDGPAEANAPPSAGKNRECGPCAIRAGAGLRSGSTVGQPPGQRGPAQAAEASSSAAGAAGAAAAAGGAAADPRKRGCVARGAVEAGGFSGARRPRKLLQKAADICCCCVSNTTRCTRAAPRARRDTGGGKVGAWLALT